MSTYEDLKIAVVMKVPKGATHFTSDWYTRWWKVQDKSCYLWMDEEHKGIIRNKWVEATLTPGLVKNLIPIEVVE